MKKLLKKLGGILLAAVMVIGMYTPVAAANDGNIIITNVLKGETYSIYKLANLESASGDAYSYKATDKWKNFLSTAKDSNDNAYVTLADGDYVSWNGKEDAGRVSSFVQAAKSYAATNSLNAESSIIANDETMTIEAGSDPVSYQISFKNLSYGWYLVTSGQGALVMLDTANPSFKQKDKNVIPEIEKKVQEKPGDYNWGKTNDANIGDIVKFETTVKVHAGYTKGYVIYDKLSDGLTFDPTSVVVERAAKGSAEAVDTSNWTVNSTPGSTTDGKEYTFSVSQKDTLTLTEGDTITITYTATVNENAVVAGEGNPNVTWLKYGNNPEFNTKEDSTRTYIWNFSVFKYYKSGSKENPLAGAKFKVTLTRDANASGVEFISIGSATDPKYRVATTTEKNNSSITKVVEIETNSTGKFAIEGLDSGIYYLYETAAPGGYNQLTAPVTFKIDRGTYSSTATTMSHKITVSDVEQTNNTIEVENQSGTKLPETGGIGTTIFYVLGGVLLLGGAVLLVTRRRMQDDQSK